MIRDLDETIRTLLKAKAPPGLELAQAEVGFDLPDGEWRARLQQLAVNCYLYDIRQNMELRTSEPILQRSLDGARAIRRPAPARIDCAYCITAWSAAQDESALEEHRLLSQVLLVLLKHPTIPRELLQGSLKHQIPPYPTVIAAQDGVKNQPEFWKALDQQLKPSLNYVVTLAVLLDEEPGEAAMIPLPKQTVVVVANLDERPSPPQG